jgi:hypothetical protein
MWVAPSAEFKPLESELVQREKYTRLQAVTRTTDATVTTLYTFPAPVNTTAMVYGQVVARRTGGAAGAANDGAGYDVRFVAKNTAGTAALIAAAAVTVIGESQAGWAVTVDANAGNIRVRVTGAADNSISWGWAGRSISIKE